MPTVLQDMPEQRLQQYQIARVAPGFARNALLPRRKAVYAHHLNRDRFAPQIAAAAERSAGGVQEGVAEAQARRRDERMMRRLKTLRLVRGSLLLCVLRKGCTGVCVSLHGVSRMAHALLALLGTGLRSCAWFSSCPCISVYQHALTWGC